MANILTAQQMQALEQSAISCGNVRGYELMERAAKGVINAMFTHWPELSLRKCHAVVLCGPGNNGGDGYAIARLLHHCGWSIRVYSFGASDKLPADAAKNLRAWLSCGVVRDWAGLKTPPISDDPPPDIFIDALFGIGLSRPIPEALADILVSRAAAPRLVAVDILSGLDTDSGVYLLTDKTREAPKADLTVTFHARKWGHISAMGAVSSGKVIVADIGL